MYICICIYIELYIYICIYIYYIDISVSLSIHLCFVVCQADVHGHLLQDTEALLFVRAMLGKTERRQSNYVLSSSEEATEPVTLLLPIQVSARLALLCLQTERQRDNKTYKQTDRQTDRRRDRLTDRHSLTCGDVGVGGQDETAAGPDAQVQLQLCGSTGVFGEVGWEVSRPLPVVPLFASFCAWAGWKGLESSIPARYHCLRCPTLMHCFQVGVFSLSPLPFTHCLRSNCFQGSMFFARHDAVRFARRSGSADRSYTAAHWSAQVGCRGDAEGERERKRERERVLRRREY